MPYKSKAQAAYMHAAAARGDIKPSVVEDFDAASKGKMKKLPEHVDKMAMGGTCYACGGLVDEDGNAHGAGEAEDYDDAFSNETEEDPHKAFVLAISKRGK